mmetsp:Transcript_49067/g.59420  ORF Transcript_49067/g.59420 Transcript_49067/m.59420 type:complete len:242 (+) Transcript_49067:55-780(+)
MILKKVRFCECQRECECNNDTIKTKIIPHMTRSDFSQWETKATWWSPEELILIRYEAYKLSQKTKGKTNVSKGFTACGLNWDADTKNTTRTKRADVKKKMATKALISWIEYGEGNRGIECQVLGDEKDLCVANHRKSVLAAQNTSKRLFTIDDLSPLTRQRKVEEFLQSVSEMHSRRLRQFGIALGSADEAVVKCEKKIGEVNPSRFQKYYILPSVLMRNLMMKQAERIRPTIGISSRHNI